MGKDDFGPISQYNSLIDPNLQGYYSKSIVRHHLRQTGLINKKGEIIPEDVWRKKIHTKERMEQASRLIASKIVQQAIEIKNLEKAEIRRKLEEVSKRELVKRIRGKSLQNRQLPLLWSNKDDSYSLDYQNKRNQSRSISPKNDDYDDIKVVEDDQDIDHRVFVPRPPKQKPLKKIRFRRRIGGYSRGVSATASKPEPVIITMIYYGKGIKIPFDTQVFESKDEITIYQQHCGGENLVVYSGLHEKGDKFSFQSKRHKEFPFGLTIFLNGRYDSRISTCCEYRHNLNVRIGINGSFGMTSVVGDHPCVKCLWEKNQKPLRAKSAKTEETNGFQKKDPVEEEEFEDEEIDVKVEKTPFLPVNTDDYENEFDANEWIVKVYTSDLNNKSFEGTTANVYINLIGAKNETEKFWLDKSKVRSNNKKLFEAGNIDEFLITSNIELDKLHQIRIGHDNTGFGSAWHLEKVEVINKNDSTLYLFVCNRWLSKDEDDGRIELILPEPKDSNKMKENVKLKIEMKHDEPILVKKRTPTPTRSPSPIKHRTPSPKLRTPSPESISESSRSPSPVQDNHRRITSNDFIKIVKEEEVASVRSNLSKSSAVSSKSKSSKSSRPASQKSVKSSPKSSDSSSESSSSESDRTENYEEKISEYEESSVREFKSVYQQLKEKEDRLYNISVDVDTERKSREEVDEQKKSPSIKKSRDNSTESRKSTSKKSASKEPSVRGESRQSNHSVRKELVSESKNSLASSSRSVPKELVSESKNSLASTSRSELDRNSALKETKSESGRSSSSKKSKQIETTMVANTSTLSASKSYSKINDNSSVKSASRKSSGASLNKEAEVVRLSSKHLDVSRASSKTESVLNKDSSSDSDDSDSSDSTAKEEADEELAKVSKASSRLSNQSLNELTQIKRNSINSTTNNKNGGNTINLIQELIVKNDSKTGSRTSLNSRDKVLESASHSHLSNIKNNEINASKASIKKEAPVIPKVNIIGTSDLEESSKSSFHKKKSLSDKSSPVNRSNASLQKKRLNDSNQDGESDDSDDSDDDETESESQDEKVKPVLIKGSL